MVTEQAIYNKKSLDEFIKAAIEWGCSMCKENIIYWINKFLPFIPRYYTWLIDILNFLNAKEIQEFITFKELLSHDIQKLNFVSAFAIVSASNGFSKLAIQLYNEAIKLAPNNDNEYISSNFNNIGTVHVEEDEYDEAISFFKKGLEVNDKLFNENFEPAYPDLFYRKNKNKNKS